MYKIYPNVKLQKAMYLEKEKRCNLESCVVFFDKDVENACFQLKTFLKYKKSSKKASNIKFLNNSELKDEAYVIETKEDGIDVYASGYSGFYYAVKTLKQMVNTSKKVESVSLDCVHIEDEPDLKMRGFMLDISRNKVPKIETIKYLIDIMSDLKMNHLELYVEGFSFEYKTFPQYLQENSYVTIEEYKEIEAYCNKNAIDLVGNENGFGHMQEWLAKPELKHLAEKEDGLFLWGSHRGPSTLDPNDEGSLELVKKMYKDMIPHSNSKYFNMNFDEPFELGLGKSKEEAEKTSVDAVYKKFAIKCANEIIKYGKTPMIWGDVLVRHNASLEDMPEKMVYLDWGYDANYPFDLHLKKLKDAKVSFVSAPGTSTWCGWYGRTYDWFENIGNSIWANFKLGGDGVVLTDWGDFGHLQHLPSTFAPLAYTGLLSYRCYAGTNKLVREFLNKFVYNDSANIVADVIMDAGNYYAYEKRWRGNGTVAFSTLLYAVYSFKEATGSQVEYFKEQIKYNCMDKENYFVLTGFLKNKVREFKGVIKDKLIKKEMINTADLLYGLTNLNYAYNEKLKDNERIKLLEEAKVILEKYCVDLKDVWLQRNKYSQLDNTLNYIYKVIRFIDLSIEYYKGGANEA